MHASWRRLLLSSAAIACIGMGAAGPITPARRGAQVMGHARISSARPAPVPARAIAPTTTSPSTTMVQPSPTPPPAPPQDHDRASASTVRAASADAHAGGDDLLQRAEDALASAVPPPWLQAVRPHLEIIGGATSWSSTNGTIRVSRFHASGPYERLRSILAHEWGHQAAYRYGTHAYLGAPPEGWPYSGAHPEEAWGNCMALTLTGSNPSRRPSECSGDSLQFIRDWLARGPGQ